MTEGGRSRNRESTSIIFQIMCAVVCVGWTAGEASPVSRGEAGEQQQRTSGLRLVRGLETCERQTQHHTNIRYSLTQQLFALLRTSPTHQSCHLVTLSSASTWLLSPFSQARLSWRPLRHVTLTSRKASTYSSHLSQAWAFREHSTSLSPPTRESATCCAPSMRAFHPTSTQA